MCTRRRRAGKRTFKEKLHNLIAEAEAAEAQALRETQLADKKTLCIQLLVDGRPQAFVDLFNLTHGRQLTATAPDGGASTSGQDDVPQVAVGCLSGSPVRGSQPLHAELLRSIWPDFDTILRVLQRASVRGACI